MTAPATEAARVAPPSKVVAVGASSGGVQALMQLLPALPADFAPAMVVVLHVPADSPTRLVEIFAPRCRVPVVQAEDKLPLSGGTVVFAPPGYHTLLEPDATCALSLDAPEHFSRPSINVLFESVAWSWRERALGILLTGANADGAEGLATIAAAGGQAWIQEPHSAQAQEMPRSALALGFAADTLELRTMSERLARMTHNCARNFTGLPSGQ